MALLRVRDDQALDWRFVNGDELLPSGPAIVVPLARVDEGLTHGGPLGVRLEAADDARALAPVIDRLALVALVFPKFRDGRNYSAARILRDELKFTGEVRAIGDVLADQVHFMRRCGVDSFELAEGVSLETAQQALARYDLVYQVASDTSVPVWRRRLAGAS